MDDSLANPAMMRLEPPSDAPLPDRFTMEHWLYLHWAGKVQMLPYRLTPFPALVHDPLDLERQLQEWSIVDPSTGDVLPDAKWLFDAMTLTYSHAVFGLITFPNRAFDRTFDLPQEAIDKWGMKETVHIVPKVPFLITVIDEAHMVTAVSTPDALSINIASYDRGRSLGQNIGVEIGNILDPEGHWAARRMPEISVEKKVVEEMMKDPVLGRIDGPRDPDSMAVAVDRIRRSTGISRTTIRVLSDLTKSPITARMTMVAAQATATGENVSRASATTVALMGDKLGGRVVIGPDRNSAGDLNISYRPGTDAAIGHHVDSLFHEAAHATEDLPVSLQHAWHSSR